MRKVEEYKRHARECRQMAVSALNEDARQQLIQMAETWESLANDREEQLERQKRITKMESGVLG